MRDTYWYLLLFVFLVIIGILFVIIPVTFILVGLLVGLAGIYFEFGTTIGDVLILIGSFTWKHWEFFLISSVILAIAVVWFTHSARKKSIYRKIKVKKKTKS